MSIFIGGLVVLILGIIGIIAWWWHFVAILQGVLPIMFIFAGALAVYLSIDQVKAWHASKNSTKKDDTAKEPKAAAATEDSDVDALRKENEELKKKLEAQDKPAKKSGKAATKAEEVVEKVEEAIGDIIENTSSVETEGLMDASITKEEANKTIL